MAAPLSKLREYYVLKKEIVERENKLIFGDYSWSKNEKTSLLKSNKSGPAKEYYTLDSLLYLLKNQDLTHVVYGIKAIETKLQVVCSSDRTDILKYLNGDSDSCMCMDEILYPCVKGLKESQRIQKSQLAKKPDLLKTLSEKPCDKNISQLAMKPYYEEDAYYTRSEAFWVKMTRPKLNQQLKSKSAIKKAKLKKKKDRKREAKNKSQDSENKRNVQNVKTEPEADFITVKTENISRNVKLLQTDNKSGNGLPVRVNKGPEDITPLTGFNNGTSVQIKREPGNATTTDSEEGQNVATIKIEKKSENITIKTEGGSYNDENISRNVKLIQNENKSDHGLPVKINKGPEDVISITGFNDGTTVQIKREPGNATTTKSEEDQNVATIQIEKKPENITIKTESESDDLTIIKVERKDENITTIEIDDDDETLIEKFEDDRANDVMATPLTKLREYNITKKEIMENGNKFIFGEYSWPKLFQTSIIRFRSDTKIEYYTLECLVFFLKMSHLPHLEYIMIAKTVKKQAVKRKDREIILMYLNGQTDSRMDINEYLSTPKKSRGITNRNLENKPSLKKTKVIKIKNRPNTTGKKIRQYAPAYCPTFLAEDTRTPEIKGLKRISTNNNHGGKSYRSTHYYKCEPQTSRKELKNVVKTDNKTDDVTIKTKHESDHETIKTKNEPLTVTEDTGNKSGYSGNGSVKTERISDKVTIKKES